ncbi:MAG: hypothetical protein J0I12_32480 [Candidatus Eremiobacteraeota bacterium]|nr:hypothetical protein [Candidatus Eremiobacteraeota bacterium]
MKWRVLVMLTCLSVLLLAGLSWQRRQWNQEKQADYEHLAWWLRRGDDSGRLSAARRAYLEGRFEECLRLNKHSDDAGDRELQSAAFQALLYKVPWPEQVVSREQIEAQKTRPRLLARVVESGYLEDRGKVRLDLLVWENEKLIKLPVGAEDWKEIDELAVVHLDRKDEHLSQLYVHGRTRSGDQRVDVFYGSTRWKRWSQLNKKTFRRLSDRVEVDKGLSYKLLEDEWVELKR